ncbi:MAG: ABC transporter ATP-binding protein [Erysipelotrichaceae bacterium]|nr:ABC transporter ATP-binding protein [Erysipelotrichaceae bacterium]
MLKINNVYKGFGEKKVLNDLSLEIHEGSIFGLVGVNGAGKSTLLRCIAGIYKCDAGNVLFNEEDTYVNEAIRKEIFLVNDDPYFPLAATIRSLKEFYASYYSLDEEAYFKTLKMFNLDENKPISSFSKGMKRQTLLLFALAIKPKLLLLDEAFDGLDPIVRYDLNRSLYEFIEDNDAIIIISSHNLKELEDICDSYGILEGGKISTYGDLLESKANINKYQLAFKEPVDESFFDQFEVLHKTKEGSVYSFVIKGDKEEVTGKLMELDPLILDTLSVNFEELFIYEHEGGKQNVL